MPHHTRQNIRFIPAHAGNIPWNWMVSDNGKLHPRACGEHSGKAPVPPIDCGSSPRMRGTSRRCGRGDSAEIVHPRACGEHPPGLGGLCSHSWFIPAHAGNILKSVMLSTPDTVHPRACGEHRRLMQRDWAGTGSSPRMRGTYRHIHFSSSKRRFIPAHAGNIARCQGCRVEHAVHPRA